MANYLKNIFSLQALNITITYRHDGVHELCVVDKQAEEGKMINLCFFSSNCSLGDFTPYKRRNEQEINSINGNS